MVNVLGLGNALVDVLISIENDEILKKLNLPRGSMQLVDDNFLNLATEATKGLKQSIAAGGSAANTINGIANLDIPCSFIGKIGSDKFGEYYHDDMVKNGIDPILLNGKAHTGRATVFISKDSERTFGTYLGAAIEMLPEELTPEMFDGFSYFHIEGYLVQNHDLIRKAMRLAHEKGVKISLDMASYNVVEANREFLKEMIENYVDILFANEEEAKAFTGKSPEESLHEFASLVDIAIVKIGSKGSMIKRNDEVVNVGVIKVNCIDTTGAGDLYAAGFLYGLAKTLPLKKCGEIGAVLSGKVIEFVGPKMDERTWKQVQGMVIEIERQ
ncbi:MAG: adenosine kinase [Bacteroidales bacterium]|nr:MAG: adenosine kinase [Bacteroidales bacterium]